MSIDFNWKSTKKEKDRHLNFIVANQEDYFDFLKLYLNSSFGVELVCMSVNTRDGYEYTSTRQLVVEFLVKSGNIMEE